MPTSRDRNCSVQVAFNISVFGNASADPRQRALATKVLMEEADSRQIARAMNTALAARGETVVFKIQNWLWSSRSR